MWFSFVFIITHTLKCENAFTHFVKTLVYKLNIYTTKFHGLHFIHITWNGDKREWGLNEINLKGETKTLIV